MKPETRKKVESFILKWIERVDPSGRNRAFYKEQFTKMTDAQLTALVSTPLPLYSPNGSDVVLDPFNNVEIAREMGHEVYQRMWITDPVTGIRNLTTNRRPMLLLPIRRQSQMIDKKTSIAKHNRSTDKTTGQQTGKSRTSAFSFPQSCVLFGQGYDETLFEFLVARGGNPDMHRVIDSELRKTGQANMRYPGHEKTRVKSTKTMGTIWKCMHIGTSL